MDEKQKKVRKVKNAVVTPEEAMRHLRQKPAPTEQEIQSLVDGFDAKSQADQKEKRINLDGEKE